MARSLVARCSLVLILLVLVVACRATPVAPPPAQPTIAPPAVPTQDGQTAVLTPLVPLCPEVPRPALVLNEVGTEGESVTLSSLDGTARCSVPLGTALRSTVSAAAESLFYVGDTGEPATVQSVWELGGDGTPRPLEFTGISVAAGAPGYYTFAVSPDGKKIAWAVAVPEMADSGTLFRNSLWVANRDGSEQVTLFSDEPTPDFYISPLRFTPNGEELLYTLAPMGMGGSWNAFVGRHQAVYAMPTTGGEATLLFDCGSIGQMLCIGDVTDDGNTLAYVDISTHQLVVLNRDGSLLSELPGPDGEYMGYPTFNARGDLAYMSALLQESQASGLPLPAPGTIYQAPAPYTAPTPIISAPGIGTLWDWVEPDTLGFFRLEEGESGLGLVSLAGEMRLTNEFPVAVLMD